MTRAGVEVGAVVGVEMEVEIGVEDVVATEMIVDPGHHHPAHHDQGHQGQGQGRPQGPAGVAVWIARKRRSQ